MKTSDAFVVTLELEHERMGTLSVTHSVDMDVMNNYTGPLGRIIVEHPLFPNVQFVCPAAEFTTLIRDFFGAYLKGTKG